LFFNPIVFIQTTINEFGVVIKSGAVFIFRFTIKIDVGMKGLSTLPGCSAKSYNACLSMLMMVVAV
jgi:hypothetical protein